MLDTLSTLRDILDDIHTRVAGIVDADFDFGGQRLSFEQVVARKVNFGEISGRIASILGPERVRALFKGFSPEELPNFHLIKILAEEITPSCRLGKGVKFEFDDTRLIARLRPLLDYSQNDRVEYTFSLNVANIAISQDFELRDGVTFKVASIDLLNSKYPALNLPGFSPASQNSTWQRSGVEVIFSESSSLSEFRDRCRIEYMGAKINEIDHTFLLSDLRSDRRPSVTHIVLDSPIESFCHHRAVGGLSLHRAALTPDEIITIRKANGLLNLAELDGDDVLTRAIDRFIVGRKQGLHHPNRVNQPNWDKLADYVIAMETLFLKAADSSNDQSLSYRFRLNGSSLLSRALLQDVRATFHALKILYKIRSTIVHGDGGNALLKPVNQFIDRLGLEQTDHQHPIGRLMLISRKIEEWILAALHFIAKIPKLQRPYARPDGWEEMLWLPQ